MTTSWYYFWIDVHTNDWADDAGNEIVQIISAIFWDQTVSSTKRFIELKILIWQYAKLTKGVSEIRIRYDFAWRSTVISFDDLWSAEYIDSVMKAVDNWTVIDMPDGSKLLPGNWVPSWLVTNFNNEIDSYYSYQDVMNTVLEEWYDYQLAKRWRIRFDLWSFADIVYIDFVSRWTDSFDTGWFLLWYTQADIDTDRLWNILWVEI